MKFTGWRWFVSSLMLIAAAATAETRPQYGGVLHVAMRGAPTSLDPADNAQPDSFGRRSLTRLMFDTLVTTDGNGRIQPWLATGWQSASGGQRWQFRIRPGVKFHDGTTLTAEIAAASLRDANPGWNVVADAESLSIALEKPDPDLPEELALSRNAIALRSSSSQPGGTGAFHLVEWQPGKRLSLAAEENCWRGRPFLDAIEIEMGKSVRDQLTALELGKADVVEVAPEQVRRFSQDKRRLVSSNSVELLALVFTRDASSPEEKLLRQALALSVDRASIRSVLLQGAGQAAGGILPNWMSGYEFVFSTDPDLARARQARQQAGRVPNWTLGYDGNDPLARLLAERVTLNAKDAGLVLQPAAGVAGDLRLMRIPLEAPDAWIALAGVAPLAGLPAVEHRASEEDLYGAETALLGTQRVIPLFHLPASYVGAAGLENWVLQTDGSWTVADAWWGMANK
ncbi:MAG TPA: ABC transporter substrate-binding protein [Candidatus Sulfotelmatobacter sp.]|nr:ABC transporter substrate-binding protein [Candidatus Sulfotelmatobacter sp.]